MPNSVEGLLNIKKRRRAVQFHLKAASDFVVDSMYLFYCGVMFPKSKLMLRDNVVVVHVVFQTD